MRTVLRTVLIAAIAIGFSSASAREVGGKGTVTGSVVSGPDKLIRTQIKSVIDLRIVELRACYVEARKRNKKLKGFMYFKWTIGWTGAPAGLQFEETISTVKDEPLVECMIKAIQTWKFEPIEGEHSDVTIQARFILKP